MKEKPTGTISDKGHPTDWKRLHALSDKEIRATVKSDPEARPTDLDFWKQAKIVLPQASRRLRFGWMRICSPSCGDRKAITRELTPCCAPTWKHRNRECAPRVAVPPGARVPP